MTDAEFDLFLTGAAGICAFGAVVALLRVRSRGIAALMLSGAFLGLGAVMWMLKSGAPQGAVVAGAVVTGILLIGDFVVRSQQSLEKSKRP